MNSDSPCGVDPRSLDAARQTNDIAEVIGAVLPLHRVRANLVGNCPFHDEARANFEVNPERQVYYCFGCHRSVDVIRFVHDFHRLTYSEVVERLLLRAAKRKERQ